MRSHKRNVCVLKMFCGLKKGPKYVALYTDRSPLLENGRILMLQLDSDINVYLQMGRIYFVISHQSVV